VADAEDRALGLVGKAGDIPAVRENYLLDDCKAEAGARFLRRKIGFENFGAIIGWDARTIIADFEHGFGSAALLGKDLDVACAVDGLDRIQQQIEQGLAEELFVGLNAELLTLNLEVDLLFFQIVVQRADNLIDD
jgi:hypothetical protein